MARRLANNSPRSRGLAIVEFVIVLPICLMLIIATAELGRAFLQYNVLTKAVRDGARFVAGKALQGSQGIVGISPGLETETQNLVVHGNVFAAGSPLLPGLTSSMVTVSDDGGFNVTVAAAYPYSAIFGFIPRFFYGGSVDTSAYMLQTAVTMRAL